MKHILTLDIQDENALYLSYLPFLKNGGIFVPNDFSSSYELGEEIFLMLTLLNEKMGLACHVAWINPVGVQGSRCAGVGVHFSEQDKGVTREKIEEILISFKSEKPTYTM